jgi:hypothetical protein
MLQMPCICSERKNICTGYTKTVNVHIIAATYSMTFFQWLVVFQTPLSIATPMMQYLRKLFTTPYSLPQQSITMVTGCITIRSRQERRGEDG